jgi:AcrR family transcriptional regulator
VPTATWDNLDSAKQRRVLDAAMREFGRHGFSAGSLNVVAREAGVAKGSLFQYFTDKLELFAFVCESVSRDVRDTFTGLMAGPLRDQLGPDPEFFDLVTWLLRQWFRYFADHPVQRGVTAATTLEIDPDVRETVRRVANRHYREVLEPLLEHARSRGDLRRDADEAALTTYLLLLFPHCALAPWVPALDPVLGLYDLDTDALLAQASRLVEPLRLGFSARNAPITSPADPA